MSYYETKNPIECVSFNPYSNNGGSIVAIAGEDYAVIGADTRLSQDFSIFSRNQKKLFKISKLSILGCSRCWGDALTLSRILESRMRMYEHENNKVMSTPALAQMLSTVLYYKRFFPYYVMNILAGIDETGKGCVFTYDPIGHYERTTFGATGSAGSLLQPLLDNQIAMNNIPHAQAKPLSKDKAMSLLKDVFISAAERDIYTGDSIEMISVTPGGIQQETFPLRKD